MMTYTTTRSMVHIFFPSEVVPRFSIGDGLTSINFRYGLMMVPIHWGIAGVSTSGGMTRVVGVGDAVWVVTNR